MRRADKHHNAKGAEILGIRVLDLQKGSPAPHASVVTEALGSDGVLVAVGFNTDVAPLDSIVACAKSVVALAGCRSWLTAHAHLVIPGLTYAEKDGLIINFEGHVQQLKPVLETKAETEWRVADLLIAAAAEGAGLAILHYDRDYDVIAAATGQEVEWVVERGSV
jgi:NADH dehydrogenase/NADH:ubiquinone oxidoreductase subunit G